MVEIEFQCRAHVVNERLHIPVEASIKKNGSKNGIVAAKTLKFSLVVFNCSIAVARGGNDMSTTW